MFVLGLSRNFFVIDSTEGQTKHGRVYKMSTIVCQTLMMYLIFLPTVSNVGIVSEKVHDIIDIVDIHE